RRPTRPRARAAPRTGSGVDRRRATPTDRPTRSADPAVAALPVRAAELELLELAGGGARELGAEFDRRRALVVGEMVTGMRDELRLARLGAGRQHDERLHRLAPLLVARTPHRHLRPRRLR